MRLRTPNLYARLLLWFVAANIATLLISVFVTERFARDAYRSEPDWTAMAGTANRIYIRDGVEALDEWRERRHRDGIDATLYEGNQNLLRHPPPPFVRRALDRLLAEDALVLRPRPEVLVIAEKVVGEDGVERRLIAYRGARPPPPRIEHLLLVQLLLSMLVIGALGWWVARSIARPVAAIADATRRMTAGDLAARVGAPWSGRDDELGRLAADFDRMAARIEALIVHERGVLQDVSHELRSPLARLHLLLDLASRAAPEADVSHFSRAEAEITRLDRIIGEALALSRMEADLPGMALERVDLAALLQARAHAFRIEADARQISLELQPAPASLLVSGSHGLLERAIDNLLSNAIKFSANGGRIELSGILEPGPMAKVVIDIRDHGPGVPDADLAKLSRPFFRGANAARAEGHGLGLAIVERIARAHHGSLSAANADGGGLRVRLILPALRNAGLE